MNAQIVNAVLDTVNKTIKLEQRIVQIDDKISGVNDSIRELARRAENADMSEQYGISLAKNTLEATLENLERERKETISARDKQDEEYKNLFSVVRLNNATEEVISVLTDAKMATQNMKDEVLDEFTTPNNEELYGKVIQVAIDVFDSTIMLLDGLEIEPSGRGGK